MRILLIAYLLILGCGGKPRKPAPVKDEPVCKVEHYPLSPEEIEREAAFKVKPIDAIEHSCPKGKHWAKGNYFYESGRREDIYVCHSKDGTAWSSGEYPNGILFA